MTKTRAKQYVTDIGRAISFTEGYIVHVWRSVDALPPVGFDVERARLQATLEGSYSHLQDNASLLIELRQFIAYAPDDGDDDGYPTYAA